MEAEAGILAASADSVTQVLVAMVTHGSAMVDTRFGAASDMDWDLGWDTA